MVNNFANRTIGIKTSPLRENAKKAVADANTISFSFGYPSEDAYPLETLRKISDNLYANEHPDRFLQYGLTEGVPELRALLKERLVKTTHIDTEEKLIITSGATQGIELSVKLFCNEGDIVLCEAQTFHGAVNSVKSLGAKVEGIPKTNSSNIDFAYLEKRLAEDVEHRIKLIYLIPTFQNPLGTSLTLTERKRVYALARAYDVVIIEDDPYGELQYSGEVIPRIKSFDEDGRVIYLGSFSKILAPSTRLGFMIASDEIIEKAVVLKQVADSHSNNYWQHILLAFLKDFDFEGHVAFLKEYYGSKLQLMIEKLEEIPTDYIEFTQPEGGYFINCRVKEAIDIDIFYQYLEDHHVVVIPGNVMSVAQIGFEDNFRLNFTRPSKENIDQGIETIKQALIVARK